jgi:hypothetical protein
MLTIGQRTNECIASYTRVEYPLGYPKHSGASEVHRKLINRDWIACEYQNADSTRRTCSCTPQVNEVLEEIEDKQCDLDLEIVRNKSVLKFFLSKGPVAGYPSPIVKNEFVAIYGNRGPLMLVLLLRHPEQVHHRVVKRLRMRAIELQMRKFREQGKWAKELERILPQQNAKFERIDPIIQARLHSQLLLGRPLRFSIELTVFIIKILELYALPFGPAQFRQLDKFRELVGALRRTGGAPPFRASFTQAAALCAAAAFVAELECTRTIDSNVHQNLTIAYQCGITAPEMHGSERLLRIVVDAIQKKRLEDGAREISGMFTGIRFAQAVDLIRIGALMITWGSLLGMADREIDLILCNSTDGVISLASLQDPTVRVLVDLVNTPTIMA